MTDSAGQIDAEQVHQALLNLYSPTELARSALAGALPECRGVTDLVQRAQLVRNVLLDLVQSLRPANRLASAATATRAYDCFMLRYVSGLSIGEVAEELSLSSRQVYRDLRWGEERLAELLSARSEPGSEATQSAADALTREMAAITHKPERLSMRDVVRASLTTVRLVAERRAVTLNYSEPEGDWHVSATPGILQQVITQLISSIAQSIEGGQIEVDLLRTADAGLLRLRFCQAQKLQRPDLLESALRVAESQGLSCRLRQSGQYQTLEMAFPLTKRDKVLILEDSPGACTLYERYLENTEFEAVVGSDPGDARTLATREGVCAVVLDIMMPELDGWTVLQSLKLDPATRAIPVVICSVVADRELGASLGAAGYLSKPVSRSEFITCLRQVLSEPTPRPSLFRSSA